METKAIQADLGIFTHISAYSDTSRYIKAHSEPCLTLASSERWYIQNPGVFKTSGISRTLAYSEPCPKSTMENS